MDEIVFAQYLNRSGRKEHVIEKYVRLITHFEDFFDDTTKLDDLDPISFKKLILNYEKNNKKEIKTLLYGLMHYFKATNNLELQNQALELRKLRMSKKSPFLLKNIIGIDPKNIQKLNDFGIKYVTDMLESGKNTKKRKILSTKTKVPYSVILELTKISDLIRLGYIKEKLSRLYYNAGVQTPADLSKWEAESLHKYFEEFVKNTKWDGAVPYLSDLRSNIERAKDLPSIIEYD